MTLTHSVTEALFLPCVYMRLFSIDNVFLKAEKCHLSCRPNLPSFFNAYRYVIHFNPYFREKKSTHTHKHFDSTSFFQFLAIDLCYYIGYTGKYA